MTTKNLFEESYNTWAQVILPLALPTTYTYAIPNELINKAKIGFRAEVQLRNKKYAGIIKQITNTKPAFETKPILNVLDDEPIVYPQQLQFWSWVANYYMCTEGEVMAAALPTNFKLSSETIIFYNEDFGSDYTSLSDNEYLLAEALEIKRELRMSEIQQILDATHVYPIVKKLIEKKVCFVWEVLEGRYKLKKENFVTLNAIYNNEDALSKKLNDWKGANKQMELLLAFLHIKKLDGDVLQSELLKKANATTAQLSGLVDKEILIVEKRSVDRIKTLPKVREIFSTQQVCLLHGITASGKTQVYVKLIEEYFNRGQQVLYLLPEIALTAQIIRRLQQYFGGHIAIYHSKFNDNERIEIWNKVRTGEIKIVLGARSTIFLPFSNLGLIIIDEEHDASYKQQDPAPRYNARDAAIFYAATFWQNIEGKTNVLLGSATPSIESFYNAKNKKYGLATLTERYGGIQLPTIEMIETRQVATKGKVMLSPQLQEAIEKTLADNKQVILFQNRRGYNPYLICGTCGFIPQCNHCAVSLTLHKFSNKLHCHYCASQYPKIIACPRCGTQTWLEKNFGTEKIEEHLDQVFTKHKIARMDVDSVKGKKAHDADGLLSFADFRVHERAFQLMEQVSGRAGRRQEQGKVLIQTSNPKHQILEFVQRHDYESMYKLEIENRQEFNYPPFGRLILLTLKHKDKDLVTQAANRLANLLSQDIKSYIVGPASPVISKIRNAYLMEILLKIPKQGNTFSNTKKVVINHVNLLHAEAAYKNVQVVFDVDPS
jgi:primosomal protein N' (replication factor Y) (superfamily II helicase)